MKTSDTWRYTEHLLYNYTRYLICIELLTMEYQSVYASGDVKAQSYSDHRGKRTSDPVYEHTVRLEKIQERQTVMQERIRPIGELLDELIICYEADKDYYQGLIDVMHYVYFGHNSVKTVAKKLGISENSVYYRKRKLVKMLIKSVKKMHEKLI